MAKATGKPKPKAAALKPVPVKQKRNYKNYIIAAILAITAFCYNRVPAHEFTNWDDEVYVVDNHFVQSLSWGNIKTIFDPKTEVSLNYHPVTLISLALNYHYAKLSPRSYLLTNIFLHLLNTLLVFIFIYLLFNRNLFIAAFVSLLFGIHPMHVESVAWVSERKDLLYCLFFMAGSITYLKYIESNKWWQLVLVFMLFILACLSKAMAASFAAVLPIMDYMKNRPFTTRAVLEKIPFFAVAVLIGILAVSIQKNGAINEFTTFTIWQRVMFASYGFMMYIVKFFVPYTLSTFYPYPFKDVIGQLPWEYYFAPVLVLTMLFVPSYLFYRHNKAYFKVYVTGMAFFSVTVAMVLQFISVGSAVMAERYAYLPYIGFTFVLGYFLNEAMIRYKSGKQIIIVLTAVFCIAMVGVCYARTAVWQNSLTLWDDVIAKYPGRVGVAYKNRGNYYAKQGKYDIAYNDFIAAVNLNSKDAGVFSNLGNIYGIRQQFDKSLEAYSKSLEYKKDNYDCRVNRGITYSMMKQYDKALSDFAEAYKLNPSDDKLYMNRSYTYINANMNKEAVEDCNYLIARYPNNADYYLNRGLAYLRLNKIDESISDFKQASTLDPKNPQGLFNMVFALSKKGRYKEALAYTQHAIALGMAVDPAFLKDVEAKAR